MAGLAGCTSTTSATPNPGVASTGLCQAGKLTVSLDDVGVRVTNNGLSACMLAGKYPVVMQVWRLDGPPPPAARGSLPPGGSYLQPYLLGTSNGCPGGGLLSTASGTGSVDVRVENTSVKVSVSARAAYEITNCES